MAVHLPKFQVGSVYQFIGLWGQPPSLEQRLKVEAITPTGDIILAVSLGPDETYVSNVYTVPYLTAKEMVKVGVWTYDEKESRR